MATKEKFEEAKRLYETANADQRYVLENLFPELAESEDERIRKTLINMFNGYNIQKVGNFTDKQCIAWLEKQGQDGKVWFYRDDYVRDKKQAYQDGIDNVLNNPQKYGFEKQGAQKPVIPYDALREGITHFGITQYQIDNWLKKYVDVEKQGEQKPADKVEPKFKVGDKIVENNEFGMIGGEITDIDTTHYELDGGGTYIPISRQDNYRLIRKQKPAAWGEEDEKCLSFMIKCFEECSIGKQLSFTRSTALKYIDFLKSLKNRVQSQLKPSNEQIKVCRDVYADILSAKGFDLCTINSELNRLEEELKKPREE